jgi:tetratricopeptide (TPR) repeat protein
VNRPGKRASGRSHQSFGQALALLAPGALLAAALWLAWPDRAAQLKQLDLRALQAQARAHPNDPELFLALGRRLRQRGDRDRAAVMIRRAYDVSRGDPRTTAALVEALIDAAEYEEAERRVTEAAARWPGSGEVRAQRSRLLAARGRFVDALGEARQAVRLAPEHAAAWQALANAAALNKQAEVALPAFREGLAREPDDAELLADMGEALARFGRAAEAEVAFSRAVKAAPRAARPAGLLGQLKATRARTPEERAAARALLEHAAARAPGSPHPRYHLGLLAARDARYAEAIRYLTECLARDPSYGEAYLTLGHVCRAAGREEEARKAFAAWRRFSEDRREVAHLELRLRRAPEDVELLRRLAARHAAAGRTRQAEAYRRRLRSRPLPPTPSPERGGGENSIGSVPPSPLRGGGPGGRGHPRR